MGLESIKSRLSITDSQQDSAIKTLVERSESFLLFYLNCGTDYYQEIPESLDFLLDDLTIEAYNRIGDEGIASISTDGFSINYDDDIFTRCAEMLEPYREKTGNYGGKSYFYFV